MLRASSEMAVATSVASLDENPRSEASARPSWRAVTMSLSLWIGTRTSLVPSDVSLNAEASPATEDHLAPLRHDWRVHIVLDLRLREGAGVDPGLIDSSAEEVVIAGSHGQRTDLQDTGDGTERQGLWRAHGSTVEVHAEGRAVRNEGHMMPDVPGDRAAERALGRPVVEGDDPAAQIEISVRSHGHDRFVLGIGGAVDPRHDRERAAEGHVRSP